MKKRRSKAGETLVETLVSVLIAALAFALLSTAAVTAARINVSARQDLSFRYSTATAAAAPETVTVTGAGKTGSAAVTLYESNGYHYYTGVRP